MGSFKKHKIKMFQVSRFKFHEKGLSLLELIIYLAIFSILLTGSIQVFLIINQARLKIDVTAEVQQNLRLALERITQEVQSSTSAIVNSSVCPPQNNLQLSSNAKGFLITSGVLQFDPDGIGVGAAAQDLTSAYVSVDGIGAGCIFTIISNPAPAKTTVQVKLKVSYNDQGNPNLKFSAEGQTTISLR